MQVFSFNVFFCLINRGKPNMSSDNLWRVGDILSDKGGGLSQFHILADKVGGGGPLHFLLTSYVNSPLLTISLDVNVCLYKKLHVSFRTHSCFSSSVKYGASKREMVFKSPFYIQKLWKAKMLTQYN